MNLSVVGANDCNQLGTNSRIKNSRGTGCVDVFTRIPLKFDDIQCVSSGDDHTVVLNCGSVYAAGDDRNFYIGSQYRKIYTTFQEVQISDEPIKSVACGGCFTLYLTISGIVIICSEKAKGERKRVSLDKKAVSIFAGSEYGGAICEDGRFYIIDKDPHKPPQKYSINASPVSIVCCNSFTCVLTSNGRVFAKGKLCNNQTKNFLEVTSLNKRKIVKLSGYNDTCAALTSDEHVIMCGNNDSGQFGDKTTNSNYSSFIDVRINERIKDVSCSQHTLFLTKSNKILGCGMNSCYQLTKNHGTGIIFSPVQIASMDANQVLACGSHSLILSNTLNDQQIYDDFEEEINSNILSKIENMHQVEEQNEQKQKINSLVAMIQEQSRTINQLVEMCHSLQQQNAATQSKMNEIIESQNKQSNEIRTFHEEFKAQVQIYEEMNSKLESVVQYVKDQDYY